MAYLRPVASVERRGQRPPPMQAMADEAEAVALAVVVVLVVVGPAEPRCV